MVHRRRRRRRLCLHLLWRELPELAALVRGSRGGHSWLQRRATERLSAKASPPRRGFLFQERKERRVGNCVFFALIFSFFLHFCLSSSTKQNKKTQINLLLLLLPFSLLAGLAGDGSDLPKAARDGEAGRHEEEDEAAVVAAVAAAAAARRGEQGIITVFALEEEEQEGP